MAVLLPLFFLFAITGCSSAAYCACKDGVSDQLLQKTLDYACGAGADCAQIQQNGACFQPNTVKSHCDYAVNSYFQRKGATGGICDFSGTATLINGPPSAAGSCVYPSNSSTTGMPTTQTTGPPITPTTPTSVTTTTTPGANPTTGTTTTTTPATSAFPGTTLSPSGGSNDQSSGLNVSIGATAFLMVLCFSVLTILRG